MRNREILHGRIRRSERVGWPAYLIAGIIASVLLVGIIVLFDQSPPRRTSSSSSTSAALAEAQVVCDSADSTDYDFRCSVRSSEKVIKFVFEVTTSKARKICSGLRDIIRSNPNHLRGWVIRIYSPLDTSNHLASCAL